MLTMKKLHLLRRNCKGLTNVLFQQQHLPAFLSTSCTSHSSKKKVNGYGDVDQKTYDSLVQMVKTSRTSCQTPERIFDEDDLLFGKVIKSKVSSPEPEPQVPQNLSPLYNFNKEIQPAERTDPGILLKISLPVRGNSRPLSVTRILQQTMPMEQAFYLERWKQRMIMELGEEGFIEYTAAVFKQGKLFHAKLEDLLLSKEENIQRPEDMDEVEGGGYLDSVEHVLSDIQGIRTLESAVLHSDLKYLGIVDCVAHYRGKLCIIEWKTSEKQKPQIERTFDNPLQVAAYVGALNHDANYNFQVDCGLVVVAYKDGSPAHAHFMDPERCLHYWNKWLQRLEEYKEKNEEKE
ncbi:mitochondrial genome maintenance exonuclease 1 [Mantella aurantiaca]